MWLTHPLLKQTVGSSTRLSLILELSHVWSKKCIWARLVGAQKALIKSPALSIFNATWTAPFSPIQYYTLSGTTLMANESRILWLSYGPANTKLFHVQKKMKRARQHIIALKNESDVWVQGTTFHNLILKAFKSIFQSSSISQPSPPHSFYSSSDLIII